MNTLLIKSLRRLFWALTALALAAGPCFAVDYYLWAGQTAKVMPDGTNVTMWGFALETDGDFANGLQGTVEVPGPLLTVPPGDNTLRIHLHNTLDEPVSIVIPGQITVMTPVKFTDGQGRQRVRSFTHETAPGADEIYEWNSFIPGTYLYHSGTHPAVQVQMGLYGGVKKDFATREIYSGVTYNNEVLVFYSEIDPALHQAVASGNYGPGGTMTSTINYRPKYFLINGAPYPETPSLPPVGVGQTTLVRFFNAGLKTHVPVLQGLYMTVVAEDGRKYNYTKTQYSLILPALKTKDVLVSPAAEGSYPLYDRRLYLTNNTATSGGMLAYLNVTPPCTGIPLPAPDAYGRIIGGDQGHVNQVQYCFEGRAGDVTIQYEVWDVDFGDEVEILVNGQHVGFAPVTANNSWSGVLTVTLPDALVNDASTNTLVFSNTYNPPNRYRWGVRNVQEAQCDGIPLPAPDAYGRIIGGDQGHVNQVQYCFGGRTGDVIIQYEVWDVDFGDEVEILVNGQNVGFAPVTANNSWSGVLTVTLPDALVNDASNNTLVFSNTYNPPNRYRWGVRNVSTN